MGFSNQSSSLPIMVVFEYLVVSNKFQRQDTFDVKKIQKSNKIQNILSWALD